MEIDFGRIFRAIRRFWWLMVSASIAVGVLALLMGLLIPKSYTSASSILIVPTSSLVGNPDTIIELTSSSVILKPILAEYGIDMLPEEFAVSHLHSYSIPGTSIVRIEVSYSDAQTAADITNDIADAVASRSYDMGLGLLQRDLNNSIYQRDQIVIQLATISAQVDQIQGQTDDLASEDRVRLDQLRNERLSLEQRKADLESGIRVQENAVATFLRPVTITETAIPAEKSNSLSPVVLGAVGVVLGGLIGLAAMLWLELRDTRIRDTDHLSQITGVNATVQIAGDENIHMLAARMAGVARRFESSSVVAASPRSSSVIEPHLNALVQNPALAGLQVASFTGILDFSESVDLIPSQSVAVLFVEIQKTEEADVNATVDILRDLGVVSFIPVAVTA